MDAEAVTSQLRGLQPSREQRPDGDDNRRPEGFRGRPAGLQPELKAKALSLLTDQQRQELDELMGPPVDLPQVRRGFGGLGGGNRDEFAERIFGQVGGDADGLVSKEEAEASQSP